MAGKYTLIFATGKITVAAVSQEVADEIGRRVATALAREVPTIELGVAVADAAIHCERGLQKEWVAKLYAAARKVVVSG